MRRRWSAPPQSSFDIAKQRGQRTMIRFLLTSAVSALKDRKGVTAAEYAVLAVGIVVVVATAAGTLGGRISGILTGIGAPAAGGGAG
jgi:pilus assembly protein Flp/PilA